MTGDRVARTEGRLSTLSLRILDVLDDGEWHDYEEVVEAVQYSIPPGEAFRTGREKSAAVVDNRDMDDVIASGRRSTTIGIINNLVGNRRIERNVNTRSNEGKKLRILERVPHVYVVRDENDQIHVFPWVQGGMGQIAIHVLDMKAESADPKAEAAAVKKIFDSLPKRMMGREMVQRACRLLMNRHNVAAALQDLMGAPEPDDQPSQPDQPGASSPTNHDHGGYDL